MQVMQWESQGIWQMISVLLPYSLLYQEPIFRQEDKDRIIAQISDLEYAVPPRIVFTADQYEINQALLNEEKEITLLIGSSNEREVAVGKRISSLYWHLFQ